MAIELLQHAIERFGVVTVMDATLYDVITGKPIMFLDTLKMSNITSEGQQKEIKGGKFADTLIIYNYGRTVSIEFQDALLSFASMNALWGADLQRTAANISEHKTATLAVAAGAVTLPDTANAVLGVINVTNGATGTEMTRSATATPGVNEFYWVSTTPTQVKFNVAENADSVTIYYTKAMATAGAGAWAPVEALIKSSSFPKTVKLVGNTFLIEQNTGKQIEAEIEIPKLKLSSNFTLGMEAEGDASVFDFGGMALVSGDHDLIKIKALRYLD